MIYTVFNFLNEHKMQKDLRGQKQYYKLGWLKASPSPGYLIPAYPLVVAHLIWLSCYMLNKYRQRI